MKNLKCFHFHKATTLCYPSVNNKYPNSQSLTSFIPQIVTLPTILPQRGQKYNRLVIYDKQVYIKSKKIIL